MTAVSKYAEKKPSALPSGQVAATAHAPAQSCGFVSPDPSLRRTSEGQLVLKAMSPLLARSALIPSD
jgi:hypothetical protein